MNRRVPNGTHGGVRGREIYLNFPPTRSYVAIALRIRSVKRIRLGKTRRTAAEKKRRKSGNGSEKE